MHSSVSNIRKTILQARSAFARAESIIRIRKHGTFKSGSPTNLPSPSPPLRRHVAFGFYGGESLLLEKLLERKFVKRFYKTLTPHDTTSCKFCKESDHPHDRDEKYRIFAHTIRGWKKMVKDTGFKLKMAKERLYHIKNEFDRLDKIETGDSSDGALVSTKVFHEYPQSCEKDFTLNALRDEIATMTQNERQLDLQYTHVLTMHAVVLHTHHVIARSWRLYHAKVTGKEARDTYRRHIKQLQLSKMLCYERMSQKWRLEAAALKVQTWFRGRTTLIKYKARLHFMALLACVRLQRMYRKRKAQTELRNKKIIRDMLLKKCDRLLRNSIRNWLLYNVKRRRKRWLLNTFRPQVVQRLKIILIQRAYRRFIKEYKPRFCNKTIRQLHPTLRQHFDLFVARNDEISFSFLNKSIARDVKAMAWNFDSISANLTRKFGRANVYKYCGRQFYSTPVLLAFSNRWVNKSSPSLTGYDWIFLRSQVNRAYIVYETALKGADLMWKMYGEKKDAQEQYAMMKSYVMDYLGGSYSKASAPNKNRSGWLKDHGNDLERFRPRSASVQKKRKSFFQWYEKHSSLCPGCYAMNNRSKGKNCIVCNLPHYMTGNVSSVNNRKRKQRKVHCWPLRDCMDINDSNKLFLLHSNFCCTVPSRCTVSLTNDREKRPVEWWWNKSLAGGYGWIKKLRERYNIRTVAQLSQLSVEQLYNFGVPKRVGEKIDDLLRLTRKVMFLE